MTLPWRTELKRVSVDLAERTGFDRVHLERDQNSHLYQPGLSTMFRYAPRSDLDKYDKSFSQ